MIAHALLQRFELVIRQRIVDVLQQRLALIGGPQE
jgi:hypothetical protein